MKIITPYDEKLEQTERYKNAYINAVIAIAKLVKVDFSSILHVSAEGDKKLIDGRFHPLINAANKAFYDHLPLVLTPDVIWYCISNAIAIYINKHSEDMRHTLVEFTEEKKYLEVERLDFDIKNKNSPWNEIVDEFIEKIKLNTKQDVVTNMQADFTTTTRVSKIASQIVIMDAVQQYFKYSFRCGCGIPEIRLSGEKNDWERIKVKANKIVEIIPKFKVWIEKLNVIFDHFINAFDDKIDNFFWKSIFHSEFLSI